MTWSPLACGIISGKYGNGVPESSRAALKVFFHLAPVLLLSGLANAKERQPCGCPARTGSVPLAPGLAAGRGWPWVQLPLVGIGVLLASS